MNTLSKNFRFALPASLALITCMNPAHAECSRSDIDYYLSKGFTTNQITTICTTPAPPQAGETSSEQGKLNVETIPSKTPATLVPTIQQSTSSPTIPKRATSETETFLRESIQARDIKLTDNSLHYTLKVCIEYGDEDMYGFAPKACPKVRYEVTLKGLEIIKSGKKYLFYGNEELHVKSNISREVIDGLNKFKPEERELILKKLESGNKTIIPIREDTSVDSVKQVLEDLAS